MPTEDPKPLTDDAFCIGCGYSLRQLAANRCPECGRPFDPLDPATMSLGQPLRVWQRWLLRPTGWPVISLALVGTAMIFYVSRWPGIVPEPAAVLNQEFAWKKWASPPVTLPTVMVWLGLAGWGLFLVLATPKYLLRLTISRATPKRNLPPTTSLPRGRVVLFAAVMTGICVFFGWRTRLAREWIARAEVLAPSGSDFRRWQPRGPKPVPLTAQQCSDVLADALIRRSKPEERLDVLRLLIESGGKTALPALRHAVTLEDDPAVLCWEIRTIGLLRNPGTEALLTSRLDDSRPEVRAAAIDALSILRHPGYSVLDNSSFWIIPELSLAMNPPAALDNVVSGSSHNQFYSSTKDQDLMDDPPIEISPSIRLRFQSAMICGVSQEEREAAARALVTWPPQGLHLRVAEWGVWLENNGHLALPKSIVDEIPPFVHRTNNALVNLRGYFRYPSMVTKPVIHFTSDVPASVDMEVEIHQGRPWFAYPRPDDFGIQTEPGEGHITPLTSLAQVNGTPFELPYTFIPLTDEVLSDCSEGYPWLVPHHRVYSSLGGGFGRGPHIYGVGLHWQSLIVSPRQLSWMTPPTVSDDPRFQWWKRLRDVPSDWVASRGEVERFLYYDGPTRASVPVRVRLDERDRKLLFTEEVPQAAQLGPRGEEPPHRLPPVAGTIIEGVPAREGLYIEVNGGFLRGEEVAVAGDKSFGIATDLPLRGKAVIARFRQMLTSYGLTAAEAEGLMSAWSPWLFGADGKRFLLRMSPADYDRQCPLRVRPAPTEVVRLGLLLSEFSFGPPALP